MASQAEETGIRLESEVRKVFELAEYEVVIRIARAARMIAPYTLHGMAKLKDGLARQGCAFPLPNNADSRRKSHRHAQRHVSGVRGNSTPARRL